MKYRLMTVAALVASLSSCGTATVVVDDSQSHKLNIQAQILDLNQKIHDNFEQRIFEKCGDSSVFLDYDPTIEPGFDKDHEISEWKRFTLSHIECREQVTNSYSAQREIDAQHIIMEHQQLTNIADKYDVSGLVSLIPDYKKELLNSKERTQLLKSRLNMKWAS